MAEPILSIVVPVYNRATIIGRALESVLDSARHAKVAPGQVELIVVDDGSSDGSFDVAQAACCAAGAVAVTVLRQSNSGPAAARNLGVAHAKAPHIAFLDSDDLWFAWTLQRCLDAMESFPDAALFFLKACMFSEWRSLRPDFADRSDFEAYEGFIEATRAYPMVSFGTNNVIVRRDVFERLSGFDVEFRCLEDTDLFLRADPEGACIVLRGDDLLGRQRGENDSLTDNWATVVDGLNKMKRKERAGLYPHGRDGDPRRLGFVGGTAVRAARLCFANGQPRKAYSVFFGNFDEIVRGGRARWTWRLALTPLLAQMRPKSYPFRMRPKTDPSTPRMIF